MRKNPETPKDKIIKNTDFKEYIKNYHMPL